MSTTAHWDRARWEAASSASDHIDTAADNVLVDALAHRLERLGAPGADAETHRWVMGRIVSELARRHQLEVAL